MIRRIVVTQRHIAGGFKGACGQCPVALAVKEACPQSLFVSVTLFAIRLGPAVKCATPEIVAAFITKYDAGEPVAPFTFDLEV